MFDSSGFSARRNYRQTTLALERALVLSLRKELIYHVVKDGRISAQQKVLLNIGINLFVNFYLPRRLVYRFHYRFISVN